MRTLYVERLLAGKIDMVVPSPSVERTLKLLAPELQAVPLHLVPHGIDFTVDHLPIATRANGERLRIVVLGRLSVHKGTELLRAACDPLRPLADITLVGCGGNGVKLATACNWRYIEKYEPGELADIMRKLAPHAALLPSVIPETFSYTLSELNALGVPAIATALGSFQDRIVEGKTGFLFEPTAAGLVDVLRRLHAQPALLSDVALALASRGPARTVAEMVADYRKLIPLAAREVARFQVGIGMQTGLSEPYRHLTGAYAQMTSAYMQSSAAYEKTRDANDKVNAIWQQWAGEFDALHLRQRWWLAPKALKLALELRKKMHELPQESQTGANSPGNGDGVPT